MKKRILVVDIGGTHVKLMISPDEDRKFDSGPKLQPEQLVAAIKEHAAGWKYDAVSVGFPSPVKNGKIVLQPRHLAGNWVDFDFAKAMGKPTQVINDAAMQALGSYHGERMLFFGLGTGLGSALVWETTLLPLELSSLPYHDDILDDRLGKVGFERLGKRQWERDVHRVVKQAKRAFIADYVVLGGGHSKVLAKIPEGAELGDNRHAYLGGSRIWEIDAKTRRKKWLVL